MLIMTTKQDQGRNSCDCLEMLNRQKNVKGTKTKQNKTKKQWSK